MQYFEPDYEDYVEGQELDLDLNRGPKAGIAKQALTSPQRYSHAFKSRAPRLAAPQGTRSSFNGNLYQYNAPREGVRVRNPGRQGATFASKVPRFKAASSPLSAESGQSSALEQDQRHWSRHGFWNSQAPRTVEAPRPLTADVDTSDRSHAGEHVDSSALPIEQAVRLSPRKLSVMSSKDPRFADVVT